MKSFFRQDDLPAGWFTQGDIEIYRHIYRHLVPPFGNTVEVGIYRGRSLMSVADIILQKQIRVYCIDEFLPFGLDAESNRYGLFQETAECFRIRHLLDVMKGTSLDRSRDIAPGSVDFVFIDADHHYEAVRQDIEVWTPKVCQGGWIGGHDYGEAGVKPAVDEFFRVSPVADSTIWLARVMEAAICVSA